MRTPVKPLMSDVVRLARGGVVYYGGGEASHEQNNHDAEHQEDFYS
jgi:hypothetical protein